MNGLFIVIMGPDGSGKTTVTSLVQSKLKQRFLRHWRFHWRPNLLPKLSKFGRQKQQAHDSDRSADIPEMAIYNPATSFVRFLYYWLDFLLGYWLLIFPKRMRDTLVIGERYFPDIFVHPVRYGFALSSTLMRPFSWFVPSPDMIFLLTDDPERIFARKGELSIELITTQLEKYQNEIRNWNNPVIIDTKSGPEHAAEIICKHVMAFKAD